MSQIIDPSTLVSVIAAHERAQRYGELLKMPGAVKRMMEVLSDLDKFLSAVYPLEIDYGTPPVGEDPNLHYERVFNSLIAAGKYGYVNPNATHPNFPLRRLTGIVREELLLFDFGREIKSDEVIAVMPDFLTTPSLIDHCLAFGAKYPQVQEQNPIVFLGSVWTTPQSHRCVPCLGCWFDERGLSLGAWRGGWRRHCRFAAVRKVLPAPAP